MDDKTVFNSSNAPVPPEPSAPPLQQPSNEPNPWGAPVEPSVAPVFPPREQIGVSPSPIPQENPFAPVAPDVSAGSDNAYNSTPPPPPNSSFLSGVNIVKILVGLVVFSLLLLFIFKVIPGFFSKNGGNVTLTYWGLWEDRSTMQSAISDFERENPKIKIDYSKQDVKQYRETLTTRIENGTGPDVFMIHNTWLPMFKASLAPLSQDVITKEEFTKDFYPTAQKDLVSNGAIYAVPTGIDTLAMYINNSLFEAAGLSAPTNWQDFITASRQLTVKDESGKIQTSGAALGAYDNITHASDIISLLLVQNGADLSNFASSLKQTTDALTFYTSFATGDGNVWDATLDPSILSFAKGNLAMYFGYSWDYFTIKAANPNLQISIVPVPYLLGQNQTIASYWAQGVSSKSKNQKEAFLFMKYLASATTAQKLYTAESKTRAFGQPYGRISLGQGLKDNPVVFPFVSQGKDAVSSFFASDTYDNGLNSQMNVYLGNAVRSILNGGSPQSGAETLEKGVAQVLTQYGK